MTEREQPVQPAARRRRKPSAMPVAAGSVAVFMALFGFMTYELRVGHDPALGAKSASAAPAPVRRVIVKRIEDHIVVTKLLPPRDEGDDGGSLVAVAPAPAAIPSSSTPVIVQRTAPAPAPAPAPVQTRTS